MADLKDLLTKDVCTICGKEVDNIGGGHYVPVNNAPYIGGDSGYGESVPASEFHCMECDPIDLTVKDDAPEYSSGGN